MRKMTIREQREYLAKHPEYNSKEPWSPKTNVIFQINQQPWRFGIVEIVVAGEKHCLLSWSDEQISVMDDGTPFPTDLYNMYSIRLNKDDLLRLKKSLENL
jgi:hypothetical protein